MAKARKKKNVKIRKRKPTVTWAQVSAVLNSKWFANLMIGLIIALLVIVLIDRIITYGRKAEIFIVTIQAPPTPEWISRERVEAFVRNDEYLSSKHSILDDDLLEEVSARFAAQSWVRRVVSVRRSWPNDLAIELEYREPVVLVSRRYLADIDGVCLHDCKDDANGFYVAKLAAKVLPVDSYKGKLDVGVGQQWEGRAIAAAAEVAISIKPLMEWVEEKNGDQIALINVRDFGKTGWADIKLHTKTGKVIEWGHADEETNPNEPSQQEKLALLWSLYKNNPRLHYKNKEGKYAERIKLQWDRDEADFE